MIKLNDIRQLGLSVTWRLLYNGLCKKLLDVDEIIEYAIEKLEGGDDRKEICELAGSCADEKEDILNLLFKLIEKNTQDDIENKKIRAAIVNKELKHKNGDYISGLEDLTDMWIKLGYPADSPHIIQGVNNHITPTNYYTQENYDYLYEKNKGWLQNELEYLKDK